ncbi:MAG TPA: DUF3313 domain-containing protein [Azonexus sp.]
MGLVAGQVGAEERKPLGAHSGFMSEATYASLQEFQSPSGLKVRRWIAPGAMLGQYEAVLLEPSVFYPVPQSTDQLSMATLKQIVAYLDEALRRELQGVIRLADEPGPKTLRFRPAITAVAARNEGLKAYQLIPVAFILTRGQTTKRAALAVEYEVLDTATNQLVAAGMRLGEGKELKTMKDTLTLEQMKPAIDAWARDARTFLEQARGGK